MRESFKKKIKVTLKGIWHILALVLLLSLPTFSFFMPGFEISDLAVLSSQQRQADKAAAPNVAVQSDLSGSRELSDIQDRAGFTPFTRAAASKGVVRSTAAGGGSGDSSRRSGASGFGRSGTRERPSPEERDRGRDEEQELSERERKEDSSEVLEDVLDELESLEEALQNVSDSYAARSYSESGSGRYINPFLRSLANSDDGSDSDNGGDNGGDSGGDSGGDNGGGDTGGGDTGGGDTGGGDSGGGSSGDDPALDPSERIYDSLLVGEIIEGQSSLLLKASRGSNELQYYLEDGSKVDLAYHLIWSQQGFLSEHGEDEIVLTSDYNGDGRDDLLVADRIEYGTTITCWTNRNNKIEEDFSGSFPYRNVSAIEFFDWNADGKKELMVAFADSGNLHVYDIDNKTIRYAREFKLPFKPASLVSTATLSPFKNSYLHVVDDRQEQHVLFNSRYPGVYSFANPVTLKSSELIELEHPLQEEGGPRFLVVHYDDRLVLLRQEDDRNASFCSLGLSGGIPVAVVTGPNQEGFWKMLLGF